MPNIVDHGYLNDGYTVDPYLSGVIYNGVWSQVNRRIDTTRHIKSQTQLAISTTHKVRDQISRNISTTHRNKEQINREIDNTLHRAKSQINKSVATSHHVSSQIQRSLDKRHTVKSQILDVVNTIHLILEQISRQVGTSHFVLSQISQAISTVHSIKSQTYLSITLPHHVGSQTSRTAATTHDKHTQIRRGNVLFITDGVYLERGYLEDPYLAPGFDAHVRSQVFRKVDEQHQINSQIQREIDTTHRIKEQTQRRIDKTHTAKEQIKRFLNKNHAVHSQADRKINTSHSLKAQVQLRIDVKHHVKEQIDRLAAKTIFSQITQVLYNTKNLRILLDFPSRGVTGSNWIASSTASGDFSASNLNTDIVEQVWRSASSVKSGITLFCDTQVSQGIFTDTLAFLNHNLTTSASILWDSSNDVSFSTGVVSQIITSARDNIYYIAPILPTSAYRFHRFTIDDGTNSNDSLQIGTIVFGSSIIFQGEGIVDQITRQTVHFSDKIATEAFTNVSNDRALKFAVGLEFRRLQINKGNYARMREIFEQARTSLKCLWIPTPQYASRFAVFGKLENIPAETHNDYGENADYVDFTINVDESL